MAKLRFHAGTNIKEYHGGDKLHLKDGDLTGKITREYADRLLNDFPHLFEEVGENMKADTKEAQTLESGTINIHKLNKDNLIDFARKRGVDIPDPDTVTKREIIDILEELEKQKTMKG